MAAVGQGSGGRSAIAVATFAGMPDEFRDDEALLRELARRGVEPAYRAWDDPDVDWGCFDLVVARSPWDYPRRREEFLAWVWHVGPRLENAPDLIAWNSDKRYLADLAADGVPVVETTYLEPGEPLPPPAEELVVKPAVSAGARDTGRFGPGSAEEARALVARIHSHGETAMVQPFVESVESAGETAVVTIGGEVSHVLRKRALLAPDEVAPVRDDALAAAEAMYDPDLVVAGSAGRDELGLTARVLGAVRARFGAVPLVARVDMVRDADGSPILIELEAIEPNLYLDQAPGAVERLAEAICDRARR